ncbi:MAG: radical SAM family heme chaperone HemW [Candidatus Latescibacterota bacterium]
MRRFGLYVHVPFCGHICPYCAFASEAGRDGLRERYVAAVCREITQAARGCRPGPLDTVFLGGGTPSRLTPEQVGRVLEAARAALGLRPAAEVTLEANPDTGEVARFRAFRGVGCNRLSLGVQSFSDLVLRRLGRRHGAAGALRACAVARQAGFDNLNLDLIYAVPGVAAQHWQETVEQALSLGPEHLSAYSLTIEPETPFARRAARGRLRPPSEEEEAGLYEWTAQRLTQAGYEHYEVSNFARPGRRSRHNWGYWTGAEYLGVGPSAHSYLAGRRSWNVADLDEYLARLEAGEAPEAGREEIDPLTALREGVWMGLRTAEGVALGPRQRARLVSSARFADLQAAGYLQGTAAGVRLTPSGFLLADALAVEVSDLLEADKDPAAALPISSWGG